MKLPASPRPHLFGRRAFLCAAGSMAAACGGTPVVVVGCPAAPAWRPTSEDPFGGAEVIGYFPVRDAPAGDWPRPPALLRPHGLASGPETVYGCLLLRARDGLSRLHHCAIGNTASWDRAPHECGFGDDWRDDTSPGLMVSTRAIAEIPDEVVALQATPSRFTGGWDASWLERDRLVVARHGDHAAKWTHEERMSIAVLVRGDGGLELLFAESRDATMSGAWQRCALPDSSTLGGARPAVFSDGRAAWVAALVRGPKAGCEMVEWRPLTGETRRKPVASDEAMSSLVSGSLTYAWSPSICLALVVTSADGRTSGGFVRGGDVTLRPLGHTPRSVESSVVALRRDAYLVAPSEGGGLSVRSLSTGATGTRWKRDTRTEVP